MTGIDCTTCTDPDCPNRGTDQQQCDEWTNLPAEAPDPEVIDGWLTGEERELKRLASLIAELYLRLDVVEDKLSRVWLALGDKP